MHSTHTKVVELERMLSNQREIWTTSDDIGTLHPPHPFHPPFLVHYYVKQIPIRSQHHLMERHSICSKTWSLFQSTLLEACRSVQWKSQRKYPHVGLLYRCDWPRCNHNQFFFLHILMICVHFHQNRRFIHLWPKPVLTSLKFDCCFSNITNSHYFVHV